MSESSLNESFRETHGLGLDSCHVDQLQTCSDAAPHDVMRSPTSSRMWLQLPKVL